MADLDNLLSLAKVAAKKAGDKILEIYDGDDFNIELKGDESPLTKADKLAHEVITDNLLQTNLPILSEEGKTVPYDERTNWDLFWMVDPLDGTKEFIKRNGEFTVNIALIENQIPILGVVLAPTMDKCYYGYQGGGAFLEQAGEAKIIKASDFRMTDAELKVVASRSHLNDETKGFIDGIDAPVMISMGSSLKFMIVAEGNAHLYPRFAPTMEWDTAAAQIIVEESGGAVHIANTLQPVKYNKKSLLNPHFLCSGNMM